MLANDKFDVHAHKCEEHIDTAKRAIESVSRRIESNLTVTTSNLSLREDQVDTTISQTPLPHSLRLPPIKLGPFSGGVETWTRFWEQFESSIDRDVSLTPINKHISSRLPRGLWRGSL